MIYENESGFRTELNFNMSFCESSFDIGFCFKSRLRNVLFKFRASTITGTSYAYILFSHRSSVVNVLLRFSILIIDLFSAYSLFCCHANRVLSMHY